MRELTYFVAVSLDGRIAAADGTYDDFLIPGDHLEMIARDHPDTLPAAALQALGVTADASEFSTVLMGWTTYAEGAALGADDPYPHLEQVVFSRSDHPTPPGVRLAHDPVVEVRRLKEQTGTGIWLCGGGRLAGALLGEIDRLVLKVYPVLLGDGRPLFDPVGATGGFELVTSTPYASGVVVNEYRTAGHAQRG